MVERCIGFKLVPAGEPMHGKCRTTYEPVYGEGESQDADLTRNTREVTVGEELQEAVREHAEQCAREAEEDAARRRAQDAGCDISTQGDEKT